MSDVKNFIKPEVAEGAPRRHDRFQMADKFAVQEQSMGHLLQDRRNLTDAQLNQISTYQTQHGLRFGEAAVALQMASNDDIASLLAKQFHYPYQQQADVGQLPPMLRVAVDPFSDGAEVFRDLRTQLGMGCMNAEQPRRALAVVSATPGDGKTFVAANLAAAFSQLGAPTLLIDANMRQPSLAKLFGIAHDAPGLSSILSGRAVEYAFHQVPSLPSLFILPAGPLPPNPQELLQRPAFKLLLEELLVTFEHVIVDTPSSASGADFRTIAARSGAVMAVARKDSTSYPALEKLLAVLDAGASKMAGVIFNQY